VQRHRVGSQRYLGTFADRERIRGCERTHDARRRLDGHEFAFRLRDLARQHDFVGAGRAIEYRTHPSEAREQVPRPRCQRAPAAAGAAPLAFDQRAEFPLQFGQALVCPRVRPAQLLGGGVQRPRLVDGPQQFGVGPVDSHGAGPERRPAVHVHTLPVDANDQNRYVVCDTTNRYVERDITMGGPRLSRRDALAALAGGVGALSGCSSVLGSSETAVRVLCAGSLQKAFLDLGSAVDARVEVEAHGSATAARLVAEGTRDPHVIALADAVLFDSVLSPSWYAHIATNELALAYDAGTDAGSRIDRADRWLDPLVDGTVRLGRTDPDLDPLGYRTLFALELAADHYDRPGLEDDILDDSRIFPETSLLARLETGAVDAAVVYRTMALDRGLDTVDLPAAVDLSDPELAVITDGALLADHGFVTDRYPTFEGDVPDAVEG
jgi:molybdate/tungstate transport system substrate-binding protein